MTEICTVLAFTWIANAADLGAADVTPDQLEFRRQAVRRMIFDRSQDIPLAGLWPAKVVGLDVMHPPVGEQVNGPHVSIAGGRLRISAEKEVTLTRWVGAFSPFAVYDVAVHEFNGSGQVGVMFRDTDAENRITTVLVVENGVYRSVRYVAVRNGREVDRQDFALSNGWISSEPIRLRAQMLAIGVHIYTYPDLKPAGELRMHRPPWNDKTGTRIWPNVVPLPEGYPARYIALMMDRLNFPGMQGANWTYGAMYLYHAYPAGADQKAYEYAPRQHEN